MSASNSLTALSKTFSAILTLLLLCTSGLRAEPLNEQQLSGLIQAGFPTSEIREMVETRGYSGALERENLRTLREAGADTDLIAYLMTTGGASPQSAELPQQYPRLFRYTEAGKYGFSDQFGRIVIKPHWDAYPLLFSGGGENFAEGLAVVREDGKYGYIDKTESVVIGLQWDNAKSFSEGNTTRGASRATCMSSKFDSLAGSCLRHGYLGN